MIVFLDANVLFTSAYSPEGASRQILRCAEVGLCETVASRYAIDEARRNIALKAPGRLSDFESVVRGTRTVPEPSPALVRKVATLPLAKKDAPILAAAMSCRADLLVTGDRKDFGHLFGKTVEGVTILPPSEALAVIVG